ncbi:MAG: AMP phosphorylase [Candidatus Diapherotrites archaeon]
MEQYTKIMRVRSIDIASGKMVSIMNSQTAKELGILPLDRVSIANPKNGKCMNTVVDFTETMVKKDEIGMFRDVSRFLGTKGGKRVEVTVVDKPKSVEYIKAKLDGRKLKFAEIKEIVNDLAENRLSEVEAAAFVSAVYVNGFDLDESVSMTKALVENGKTLEIKGLCVDKHSIGGLNGRTTMAIVPIIAAAGYNMPKTSSRSITSAAGTADAMEVMCNVSLPLAEIKQITEKVGGVIAWGGAVELAPADDKIIKIEHPLLLDPEGQVVASVMAKKASVGAKFVVIDLPVGPDMKVKSKEQAESMALKFLEVGKAMGIKVEAILTDGTEPCGMAFGPALEAKWLMEILEGKRFDNLADKSCELAGVLIEMAGGAPVGKGYAKAKEILTSGKALAKMKEIIKAQHGTIFRSEDIEIGKYKEAITAQAAGEIKKVNVKTLNTIARLAGAPADKKAGVLLKVREDLQIQKNALLFEIYATNKRRLEIAVSYAKVNQPVEMEKMVLERFA